MLAQNVIFPSIAPSHVPTPSRSLHFFLLRRYLTAPKIMPTETAAATVSPNEVHKSGSRSPFFLRPTDSEPFSFTFCGRTTGCVSE